MAERAVDRASTSPGPPTTRRPHRPANGSFELQIRMLPGLTPRQELMFEQALTRHLGEHDLVSEGTPLRMTIRSDGRELTVTDQVDLVAWLMMETPVASVRVSGDAAGAAERNERDGGLVFQASRCDLALLPALQLYRLGRMQAQWVAQILAP